MPGWSLLMAYFWQNPVASLRVSTYGYALVSSEDRITHLLTAAEANKLSYERRGSLVRLKRRHRVGDVLDYTDRGEER